MSNSNSNMSNDESEQSNVDVNETMSQRFARCREEDRVFERTLQSSNLAVREKNRRRNERSERRHEEDLHYIATLNLPVHGPENNPDATPGQLDFSNVSASSHKFKVKMPKMTTLVDMYNHEALKDFVHMIERNGLQGETRKFIERSASDQIKRKVSEDEPDESVFVFLQNRLIHSIGERSKIKYWVRKVEFSLDFTRTVEDRLDEFFGYAAEGEAAINGCSTDGDVSRAYVMKMVLKLDPRLKISQKYLIENPQIKSLKDLADKAYEVKARGEDECGVEELQKLYAEGVSPAYSTKEEMDAVVKIEKNRLRLVWGKKRQFEMKSTSETNGNTKQKTG